jgi:hypothetical protein
MDFAKKKELKRKKRQEKLIKEVLHMEAVKKVLIAQTEQEKNDQKVKKVS